MSLPAIQITAFIGLLFSAYALYVEKKTKKSTSYKAACDISDNISCTKAFKSKYAKMAGMPNSFYGILFYILIIILTWYNNIMIILFLSVFAVIGTLYLAYISYFKLKNLCVVCTSIYLINFLLLTLSYQYI